ncbi:hypothetical protein KIN20_037135 [Parelaphostrongylus tenuis]|uniref:Uncharacterized protein n=1 Tax=Parelaphostrongylus tenuis TaxID=148309 RepID=A0AAD5RDS7_PARTN|nr:hypothetical protein KIN20_037135 [Parelaphostrongylus tenuis]
MLNLVSSHLVTSSITFQCTSVHSIPSKDHPISSSLTTANLNSSGAEVNDLQNASSQLNIRSSGHSVGTGDRPYSATLSTAKLCSCGAKLDNLRNASSQHNTCSSVYDVEDENSSIFFTVVHSKLAAQVLTASHPSIIHTLRRWSTANLHSSVANLDHQLECSTVQATKAKTSSCSTQLSTASLHTSDGDINHSSHAFSLHKAFSSGHSIRSKDTQNSSRLSTANLCSSGGELDNKHSASSQQNICSNDQTLDPKITRIVTASHPKIIHTLQDCRQRTFIVVALNWSNRATRLRSITFARVFTASKSKLRHVRQDCPQRACLLPMLKWTTIFIAQVFTAFHPKTI